MAGGKIFRSRLRGRTASAVTSDEASGFERASWGTVREFRTVVGEGTSLGVGLWCRARQVLHSINQPRRRRKWISFQ